MSYYLAIGLVFLSILLWTTGYPTEAFILSVATTLAITHGLLTWVDDRISR